MHIAVGRVIAHVEGGTLAVDELHVSVAFSGERGAVHISVDPIAGKVSRVFSSLTY